MMKVFTLNYYDDLSGIFTSREKAEQGIVDMKKQPAFADAEVEYFFIEEIELDRVLWITAGSK